MLRWFLILTKPSGERTAKENLERQGYRVYYPRLARRAFYRGRWTERIVSLFPRYVFLQIDAAQQSVSPVRSTRGVVDVVRFGNECAVVANAIVDGLIQRADAHCGLHRLNCDPVFAPGDAVSVIGGTLQGFEGIFEREMGKDRVVVLLKILGRETPVRLPLQFLLSSSA